MIFLERFGGVPFRGGKHISPVHGHGRTGANPSPKQGDVEVELITSIKPSRDGRVGRSRQLCYLEKTKWMFDCLVYSLVWSAYLKPKKDGVMER